VRSKCTMHCRFVTLVYYTGVTNRQKLGLQASSQNCDTPVWAIQYSVNTQLDARCCCCFIENRDSRTVYHIPQWIVLYCCRPRPRPRGP
jgi:hypothetical protein